MKRMALFVDAGGYGQKSLDLAISFAKRVDADLDVLSVRTSDKTFEAQPAATPSRNEDATSGGNAKKRRRAPDGGRQNPRWIDVTGTMDDAIRSEGLLYDALIVERLPEESGLYARVFNTALFATGLPVLVTPPAAPTAVGDAIAVVWNGTAQATRAMRSAVPFLQRAGQVHLLTNLANVDADPALAMKYLQQSGIAAKHLPFDGSKLTARGRGRAIIEAAKSVSADLLVMGAFGEGRFETSFHLGRATRKLLSAAPVPLLLQS